MADGSQWDLISSYAGLLSLATLSIYAGSVGSIPTSKSRKPGASSAETAKDDDEEEEEDITDRLSAEDAWLFPVIGSFALFGMYVVVKYLGKEWINFLLGWYFAITGVASVWKSSISLFRTILGPKVWTSFDKVHFTLHKGIFTKSTKPNLLSISLRTPSLVLLPFAVIPSMLYQTLAWGRKSAILTNILGLSFSHNALSLLKLDSFKTGTILLSGLFIYDIWWVFGTEVMVKVATNLDLPIKILWPKSALFDSSKGYTMLGLGDIVIPGTFIALALRYDYYRHTVATKSTPEATSTAYPKPYFTAGVIAYVSGLVTTMTVMHVFRAAQPALLYLSPACILSFLGTAAIRGELSEAWKWADDPAKEKEDAKKKEGDAKKKEGDAKKTGEQAALLDQTPEGASGYGAVMQGATGERSEDVADPTARGEGE